MLDSKRLFDIPHNQLKNHPNDRMFVSKIGDKWIPVSTQEFLDETMAVSKGLIALGVQPKDNVAIVSPTRYEWNVADIAIQQTGAIVVPIYPNISEKDYEYIFNDAKIKICIIADEELFGKISHIQKEVSTLERIFTIDAVEGADNWSKIKEAGKDIDEKEVHERMKLPKHEDLATIIYTSGTTGNPKGGRRSHRNRLSKGEA